MTVVLPSERAFPWERGHLARPGRRPVMDDPPKARDCPRGLEARAPRKGDCSSGQDARAPRNFPVRTCMEIPLMHGWLLDSRLRGNDGRGRSGSRRADCHSRLRGNDSMSVGDVIPARPVLATTGSGSPQAASCAPRPPKVSRSIRSVQRPCESRRRAALPADPISGIARGARRRRQPRMRSPRGSSTGSRTSVARRRSPRISIANSVPPPIISNGTKPSATLFAL